MEGKINRIGWFVDGKLMNWDTGDDEGVVVISKEGKVLVGGVEIVPWTHTCKKSKGEKGWLVPGVKI